MKLFYYQFISLNLKKNAEQTKQKKYNYLTIKILFKSHFTISTTKKNTLPCPFSNNYVDFFEGKNNNIDIW
jgi:type IV secretory pathway VirB6-like protein